jgi:hypothetical protein
MSLEMQFLLLRFIFHFGVSGRAERLTPPFWPQSVAKKPVRRLSVLRRSKANGVNDDELRAFHC